MTDPLIHAPRSGAESLAEPLRSRWSPSVFAADRTLSPEQITTLLHAAQWSPSAGNSQPWRFFVAQRGNAAHRVLVEHLSRGNSGWVPRASVVFVTCTQVEPEEGGKPVDPRISGYDLGQAAAHLTLQARAMGLHAHQFAGFDREEVAAALGVPATFAVLSGIAVGDRGDADEVDPRDAERDQRVRVRRPLTETAYGDRWGEPWSGLTDPD